MRALRLAAFRISVTVLAIFGAGLVVISDDVFFRATASAHGWSPEQAAWINRLFASIWTVEALLAAAIVLALVWRASERADARALAWFLAFLTNFSSAESVQELGLLPPTEAARIAVGVFDSAIWWLALAAFLRFSVIFPRPLAVADFRMAGLAPWRRHLLNPRVVWGGAALLAPLSFGIGRFVGGELWSGPLLAVQLAAFLLFLALVFGFLWGIEQGVRHLRIGYRIVGAADRRRILWVVLGFSLAMWAIFIGLAGLVPVALAAVAASDGWVLPVLPFLVIVVAPLVIVVFLAVAIFYDGAIDPALVIRRTALYGAFGVVLTFLYAGVENVVSSALAERLGLPERSASWIAAGAVALVFGFARHGIARFLRHVVSPLTPTEKPQTPRAMVAVEHPEG